MRVITGKYRGRQLKGPKHPGLRPTADRVKEALFNIIGPAILDARFLDLFAGTGAIGIEALSRGAEQVVFADANLASIQLVKENLHFVDAADNVRVIHAMVDKALAMLLRENLRFDIAFLDPPFEAGLLDQTVRFIWEANLLAPGGLLIAEHSRKLEISRLTGVSSQVRQYGDIALTLMHRIEV